MKCAKSLQKTTGSDIFIITSVSTDANAARALSSAKLGDELNRFDIKSKNSISELVMDQQIYKLGGSKLLVVRFFRVKNA